MTRDEARTAVRQRFRPRETDENATAVRAGADDLLTALSRFAELLPDGERPADSHDLLDSVADTNAFEPLRHEGALPVTVVFYPSVHPAYYEGDSPIGAAAWRLCYTDGGAIGPSPIKERLLDEAIRLAEAMHDKNPFGEVPFDGGKTVFAQEGERFQAVTALYGEIGMTLFILGKGGIRHYAPAAPPDLSQKRDALRRWAASSTLADILARKYIGGPDMRMGEEEMAWVDEAAAEMGAARRVRLLPPVTGLAAEAGGFPHQAWELTGRTVAASLKEALRHPGMARYGLDPSRPIRVLIQGFGDVGGSVARLLTEESPDFDFRLVGVADEFGALYRAEGLEVAELLRLRRERRPITGFAGAVDGLWLAAPAAADRNRPEFRGTDSRQLLFEDTDVFIPAAIPNVIDAAAAPRLRVRLVAEGANNAVAPHVEEDLHRQGVLYLPGQVMNWGGVKGSTLEALFRELTKRTIPLAPIEGRVREALAPLGPGAVDVAWALELLRSGLSGAPLSPAETRAFAIAVLEDLARSNTRWLMNELVAARYARPPLEIVRGLARNVRALKAQLLSLIEGGLGAEFFDPATPLQRLRNLLDDKLKELLSSEAGGGLTATQVAEQRQMLQQLQNAVANGLSPVFASLLAALDLARQKVMDPDSYSQDSLRRDLATLRRPVPAAPEPGEPGSLRDLEDSLYRLQRVHPGPDRAAFVHALAARIAARDLPPVVRRNAALAVAKLGSAHPGPRAALLGALADPDLSVRAACRWALGQMALPAPEAP